jgi:hypothetical protein
MKASAADRHLITADAGGQGGKLARSVLKVALLGRAGWWLPGPAAPPRFQAHSSQ